MPHEDLEDTSELARRTKSSESFWHKLRVAGGGPPFVKVGSMVRYRPSAVDDWLANHTRNSTADLGPKTDAVTALPQQQRRKGSSKTSKLERAKAEAERAAMVAAMEATAARARRGGPEAA